MSLTIFLFTALVSAAWLIAVDVYAYKRCGGLPATMSWQLWQASKRRPLIPFLVGFTIGLLAGHFFWQMGG